MQTVASLLFILGIDTYRMAILLVLFLVPVTVFVHDFWTILDDSPPTYGSGGRNTVPTFWREFDSEFVGFFKNVGMIGGLLVYIDMYEKSVQ